jgi:hypothetical protein
VLHYEKLPLGLLTIGDKFTFSKEGFAHVYQATKRTPFITNYISLRDGTPYTTTSMSKKKLTRRYCFRITYTDDI